MTNKPKSPSRTAAEEMISLISELSTDLNLDKSELIHCYSNVALTLIRYIAVNITEKNKYIDEMVEYVLELKTEIIEND